PRSARPSRMCRPRSAATALCRGCPRGYPAPLQRVEARRRLLSSLARLQPALEPVAIRTFEDDPAARPNVYRLRRRDLAGERVELLLDLPRVCVTVGAELREQALDRALLRLELHPRLLWHERRHAEDERDHRDELVAGATDLRQRRLQFLRHLLVRLAGVLACLGDRLRRTAQRAAEVIYPAGDGELDEVEDVLP